MPHLVDQDRIFLDLLFNRIAYISTFRLNAPDKLNF